MGVARSFELTRRTLVLALVAAPTSILAAPCPPPRVLFVCPAGTVKSPIARELLRAEAQRRGLAVDVRSRGVAVDDHVSEALRARLRADRVNSEAEPARNFVAADVSNADVVVAFDAAADDPRLTRARAWRTPSWNADYDTAKADMQTRIAALADELQRQSSTCP